MCYRFHRGDDHFRVVSSVVFMKGKSIKELEFVHATRGQCGGFGLHLEGWSGKGKDIGPEFVGLCIYGSTVLSTIRPLTLI